MVLTGNQTGCLLLEYILSQKNNLEIYLKMDLL